MKPYCGNFRPNSHRSWTKKENFPGLIARHCQGTPSGFFFKEIVGVNPPLLSLTIFSIVHTFSFSRLGNLKHPKRSVPSSSAKKSNTKRSRTIKSPADPGEAKIVKIYTGPVVDVNWDHMQKGIKVSVPGSYWGGGINKIKNRTR